jgi:hypothetical protein
MIFEKRFLTQRRVSSLAKDVLTAYDGNGTALDLASSEVVEEVRLDAERLLGRKLHYYGAFLFFVAATTMETATGGAEAGWHIDGTCQSVEGDCFNAWIPLYCRSSSSGIEVISKVGNRRLYDEIGPNPRSVKFLVRARAEAVFDQLGVATDFAVVEEDSKRLIPVSSSDLVVSAFNNVAPGDLALFRQDEIHRGTHKDGIRIQLSVKFRCRRSVDRRAIGPLRSNHVKPISKHGRLELLVIRELLSIQAGRNL